MPILIIWIILAIFKLLKNKFIFTKDELIIKELFILFIIPKIVIHTYSIILFILGFTDYITRNTQTYMILLSAFSILYLFKKDVIKNTVRALIISFSIVLIYNITAYGINTIPEMFMFLFTGDLRYDNSARLYEVHDYTLALGYIIIYYLFIKKKFTNKDLLPMYIIFVYMLLGDKRIEVLALLMIIIYVYISKFFVNKFKLYKFISYISIFLSYIFIWSLSEGVFFELIEKMGINTMGRNYYYNVIISLTNFNPLFLGFGRNWVTHSLINQYSYLNVAGLHSDILKYFAECGFIGFGLWLWFYLVKILKIIEKRYGYRAAFSYHILTLYTFILYYTDNIETYFVCQFIYTILIVKTCIDEKMHV